MPGLPVGWRVHPAGVRVSIRIEVGGQPVTPESGRNRCRRRGGCVRPHPVLSERLPNLLDDGIGDLGDLLGVVCSLAWRATLAHPVISRNGCRLCNTRDDSQPMPVPRPVCGLRPKSCLEPDRTLIDRIEKCSPAQHFALNAVNGYLDFVTGTRDDGGDARCHDAVAMLNR